MSPLVGHFLTGLVSSTADMVEKERGKGKREKKRGKKKERPEDDVAVFGWLEGWVSLQFKGSLGGIF